MEANSSRDFITGIQGLRGFAISLVMLMHFRISPFNNGGFLGVDVFFVISGFLITRILLSYGLSENMRCLKQFYWRRALRLLPALFAFLLFFYFFYYSDNPTYQNRTNEAILSVLFYYSNWVRAWHLFPIENLSHLWSLSFEEQFYFIWPLLLAVFLRIFRSNKVFIAGILSFIFLALPWFRDLICYDHGVFDLHRCYNGLDTRCDGLILGCILALLEPQVRRILPRIHAYVLLLFSSIALTGILLITAQENLPEFFWKYGLSIFVFLSGILILDASVYRSHLMRFFFETPPLVFLGKISYSLYLWHFLFANWPSYFFYNWNLDIAAGICLSILAATASYYLIEKPFLKFKSRH